MMTDTTKCTCMIAVRCAALVSLLACGAVAPEPVTPEAGTVAVILTTPNADDGAILFSIVGDTVARPRAAAPSHRVFYRATGAITTAVVVVGDLTTDPVLLFDVPDLNRVDDLDAIVLEVAGRDNTLRPSLSGYRLEVRREEE